MTNTRISRRVWLRSAAATLTVAALRPAMAARDRGFVIALSRLEQRSGGRLGVALLGTGPGPGYRMDERFPMCSTFKLLAAAAVLARIDRKQLDPQQVIRYTEADMQPYAPVTREHLAQGMTLVDLCGAAVTLSDNAAANLLLKSLGGPAGVTAFARSIGDPVTRLDRTEPDLNTAIPGDPRDTTTPAAITADLRALIEGDALSPASRGLLRSWLIACQTGSKRLRAHLPAGWTAGDKTGTGPDDRGTANDVAVFFPPGRSPFYVAAYLTGATVKADAQEAILAEVGRLVFAQQSSHPVIN